MNGYGLCFPGAWTGTSRSRGYYIIGYRSENSKGFLMQDTNSANKRRFLSITGFIFIILMGLVIRESYHNTANNQITK